MMSPQSFTLLTAFLSATATVSALPVEEKRDSGDWVTATIDGVVVSWANNYGVPTAAPTSVAPIAASATAGGDWVTATINGVVVSWINNYGVPTAAPTAPVTPAAATATVATAPAPTSSSASSCKDVHIFLARGWNEPYPGRQGKLAGAICNGLDSCDYEDIVFYDADGSDYCTAVTEGDNNGVAQMTAYAEMCPNSKLVLTGYSEGANVVGDILGGSASDCTNGYTGGLDPSVSPGSKIGAALVFGDPLHVADQPYNWLTGSSSSAAGPRSGDSLERLNKFSHVLRSYCDGGDPLCAAAGPGPFDVENHLSYFDRYTDEAAEWVKSMLGY